MRCAALVIIAAACAMVMATPARAQSVDAPASAPAAAVLPVVAAPLPAAVPGAPVGSSAPWGMVAAPAPRVRVPFARRWWFWASLGGAAVGVIVAGILLTPRDPYVGNAQPDGTATIF